MSVLSTATAVPFAEQVTARRFDSVFAKRKGTEQREHIHTRKTKEYCCVKVWRKNRVNWKYITGRRIQAQVLDGSVALAYDVENIFLSRVAYSVCFQVWKYHNSGLWLSSSSSYQQNHYSEFPLWLTVQKWKRRKRKKTPETEWNKMKMVATLHT